jgi:hypothetical protein
VGCWSIRNLGNVDVSTRAKTSVSLARPCNSSENYRTPMCNCAWMTILPASIRDIDLISVLITYFLHPLVLHFLIYASVAKQKRLWWVQKHLGDSSTLLGLVFMSHCLTVLQWQAPQKVHPTRYGSLHLFLCPLHTNHKFALVAPIRNFSLWGTPTWVPSCFL